MSVAAESVTCIGCGQALASTTDDCPNCGLSGAWQDLLAAERYCRSRFQQWAADRLIGPHVAEAIDRKCLEEATILVGMAKGHSAIPTDAMLMSPDQCWSCRAVVAAADAHCRNCGVPVRSPLVAELRYLTYACHKVKAQCDEGRLPLSQAHACMNAAKGRLAGLRGQLQRDRVAQAEVVHEAAVAGTPPKFNPTAQAAAGESGQRPPRGTAFGQTSSAKPPAPPRPPRRPLLEILLDPRTIQWLLGLGGVLLVLGLVIWLATLGIFKNPVVVAVALGIANGGVLAGGWAVIRYTRYQTAGRALTLLACLVMPLNLWFYHANNLITLDNHLWLAALVCCVLYLASALVLRDRLFVYVFTGGIAMTGLLMLADNHKFWEITSPAAMLTILGLLAIHIERAFPDVDGPFGRRKFGLAFFQSGHVLLTSGLALVFGAQLTGDWLYQPLFEPIYQSLHIDRPLIVTAEWGRFIALAIILAGTYAYFYSDIVVRRAGLYVYSAVFTLLWAEMFVIELVVHDITIEVAIIALAVTAFVVNLLQPQLAKLRGLADSPAIGAEKDVLSLIRAGQPLGLFLCTVPVLLGVMLHLRATYQPLNDAWPMLGGGGYTVGWLYVLAMFATAVSCRFGAYLYRRSLPWLSATYFFGTAAATLTGVVGLLSLCGYKAWDQLAPLVMIVPILYIIAARCYRGHTQEKPVALVAHAATAVMVVSVLAAWMHLAPPHVEPVSGKPLNLLLAAFFGEVALFYGLATTFRRQVFSIYLGTAAACGALWQLLLYWHVAGEYYTLTFALLGFALLICYRLALLEWTGLAEAAFQCANALMSLSFVAAALMTLSRMVARPNDLHYPMVFLLLGLGVLSLLAAWLVRDPAGRRWYVVMAIAEAGIMFLTLHMLSTLNAWQKLEIFSVVVGLALLVIGHIGWHREQEQHNDFVSFALFLGSMLAGLPLMIAVLIYRGHSPAEFSTFNELGMLVIAIVMLTTGFAFQLRATAITGAGLMMVYLLSLVLFIKIPENLQTAAMGLTIGGGIIFGAGILLSIYRDRLLALPDKVRRREGIFRILTWR